MAIYEAEKRRREDLIRRGSFESVEAYMADFEEHPPIASVRAYSRSWTSSITMPAWVHQRGRIS
jgi:hypothetical protein